MRSDRVVPSLHPRALDHPRVHEVVAQHLDIGDLQVELVSCGWERPSRVLAELGQVLRMVVRRAGRELEGGAVGVLTVMGLLDTSSGHGFCHFPARYSATSCRYFSHAMR